jgi:hypothetical protein
VRFGKKFRDVSSVRPNSPGISSEVKRNQRKSFFKLKNAAPQPVKKDFKKEIRAVCEGKAGRVCEAAKTIRQTFAASRSKINRICAADC